MNKKDHVETRDKEIKKKIIEKKLPIGFVSNKLRENNKYVDNN